MYDTQVQHLPSILRRGPVAVGDHELLAFIFKCLMFENLTRQVKTVKDGVF